MTGQASKTRALIRLAAAAVLALALAGEPAVAQKRDGADIGQKQQDLQQTQKRLNEERQKAADAKKREAGLLAELESIDKRVTDRRKQVVALDGGIRKAQADIGDLQADIGKLGRQRLGQEEVLERRLRAFYKLEAQGGALPSSPLRRRSHRQGRAAPASHHAGHGGRSIDSRVSCDFRGLGRAQVSAWRPGRRS